MGATRKLWFLQESAISRLIATMPDEIILHRSPNRVLQTLLSDDVSKNVKDIGSFSPLVEWSNLLSSMGIANDGKCFTKPAAF